MTATTIRSEAEGFLAELTEPARIGNDIVNFLKKLGEWAAALNLGGIAKDLLHPLFHYIRDVFLPGLFDSLPQHGKLLLTTVVYPLLDKFHDSMFGPDTAAA